MSIKSSDTINPITVNVNVDLHLRFSMSPFFCSPTLFVRIFCIEIAGICIRYIDPIAVE